MDKEDRRSTEYYDGMHFHVDAHYFNKPNKLYDFNDVPISDKEFGIDEKDIEFHPDNDGDYRIINGMHARIYKALGINCADRDTRAMTIIHEASHIVLGAEDKSYEKYHDFYGLSTEDRLDNASTLDNYAGSTVDSAEFPLNRYLKKKKSNSQELYSGNGFFNQLSYKYAAHFI